MDFAFFFPGSGQHKSRRRRQGTTAIRRVHAWISTLLMPPDSSRSRLANRRTRALSGPASLRLEALEQRLLLSAVTIDLAHYSSPSFALVASGNSTSATLTLKDSGQNILTTATVDTSTTSVTILGTAAADVITINPSRVREVVDRESASHLPDVEVHTCGDVPIEVLPSPCRRMFIGDQFFI